MNAAKKKHGALTWIVGALLLLMILAAVFAPKELDWSYSFSKKHEIPFGTYLVHESLPTLFPDQEIVTSWVGPRSFMDEKIPLNTNFIFINGRIRMKDEDARELIDVASAGNHVFIAAEHVYGLLADTFQLDFEPEIVPDVKFFSNDSVGFHFANSRLKSGFGYWYPRWMTRFYFSDYDSTRTTVLGHDQKGKTNFIRVKSGDGYFYFNCNPLAFTNYHLLSRNNSEYIFKALSYLPVQATVWDEYYKPGSRHEQGLFDFVLTNRSLRIAWYILFFGVIVLFVFGARRKQRAIPILSKPENTTLSFVATIARLYFSRRDHLDIARKRFTYFLEFLRSRYYVDTGVGESRVISEVSRKSGVSERSVAALFKMGNRLDQLRQISQEDLEQFNRQIEFFYNNCR